MHPQIIDVHNIQAQLADLLSLLSAGTEVIITDAVRPVARLVPIPTPDTMRVPGLHAESGKAWTSGDFDEPLPDEFWVGVA